MVTLYNLSSTSFASAGKVPICERDGRLCTVPIREITGNSYVLEFYPEININRDMFNSTSSKCIDSWQTVLIPVNEHVVKRITRTFFESGLYEALNEARSPQSTEASIVISSLAKYTLSAFELYNKLKVLLLPHLKEQGTACIAKFSQTRDWAKSYIRCIVWHPNCFKIAVAGSDDLIRIYKDEPAVVPVLKYVHQKGISSMAWRPFSAAELAVGCQTGICYWTIDNGLHISKPASQAILLKHEKHYPVTSIEWSPDGNLLASSSINDTNILIWNVDKSECAPLRRVGPPCSLLKWSPNNAFLFSSTVGNVFRVWQSDNLWKPERWTIASGTIKSAAWSPCGQFLLFVTSDESILYRLQFFEEQLFTNSNQTKQALPIADLSKVTLGNREVGGFPQSIAWDPNGRYLAIIFKDSSCIAIFCTSLNKFNLNISPSCFLTGIGTEHPSFITFQSLNRRNSDSVLTIGWSTGRIQYFPFVNM